MNVVEANWNTPGLSSLAMVRIASGDVTPAGAPIGGASVAPRVGLVSLRITVSLSSRRVSAKTEMFTVFLASPAANDSVVVWLVEE